MLGLRHQRTTPLVKESDRPNASGRGLEVTNAIWDEIERHNLASVEEPTRAAYGRSTRGERRGF